MEERVVKRDCLSVATLVAIIALVSACDSQMQLGAGGSVVSGSGGSAGAQGASSQLVHCTAPLGTAALVEPNAQASALLSQVGLQSPLPLMRLIMAQSGCFRVVDRGAALGNMTQEVGLAQSGMLKTGSATAQGRMIAVQYLVTPNVIFSNPNAGGRSGGAGLGGLIPGGALLGAVAGSMRVKEAQTALFVTDAQSGEQVAVSEGSAKATDFGGAGGLAGFGGGIAGFGGVGGYGNTAEGKLIAAALLDSFNKLVARSRRLRRTSPAPRAASARRVAPILGRSATRWKRSRRSSGRRGRKSWPPIRAWMSAMRTNGS
jgi:curli biogenesis system outer membrane secretion channel CsgG